MTPAQHDPVQGNALGGATTQHRYEQTLARVKQLEKDHPERPESIRLWRRNFDRLMDELGYPESDQKYFV